MLLFNTKLPLKETVTREMIIRLIIEWLGSDYRYALHADE